MAKYYNSTYIIMRSKEDADEFLQLAKLEGDETADNYPFPEELSWQKTQLIMKIGKLQSVMWENPQTGEKKFYKIHKAWKSHKVYENLPEYSDET